MAYVDTRRLDRLAREVSGGDPVKHRAELDRLAREYEYPDYATLEQYQGHDGWRLRTLDALQSSPSDGFAETRAYSVKMVQDLADAHSRDYPGVGQHVGLFAQHFPGHAYWWQTLDVVLPPGGREYLQVRKWLHEPMDATSPPTHCDHYVVREVHWPGTAPVGQELGASKGQLVYRVLCTDGDAGWVLNLKALNQLFSPHGKVMHLVRAVQSEQLPGNDDVLGGMPGRYHEDHHRLGLALLEAKSSIINNDLTVVQADTYISAYHPGLLNELLQPGAIDPHTIHAFCHTFGAKCEEEAGRRKEILEPGQIAAYMKDLLIETHCMAEAA